MKNTVYLMLSTICMYLTSADANVDALWCYQCNSLLSLDQCTNLDKMGSHYHPCEPPKSQNNTLAEFKKPLCRKMKQKIKVRNNLKVTVHSCGWELYKDIDTPLCYESKYDDYEEVVCQCFENGCNSSIKIRANSTLILTFGILALLISSFDSK